MKRSDVQCGAAGSTAAASLEARSTPLPPVAELPPVKTSADGAEDMGSGGAAAAVVEPMPGAVRLCCDLHPPV